MKIFYTLTFVFFMFVCLPIQPAEAGAFRFGTKQSVHKIEDIALKGPEDEELFLGHLVETQFFILGAYVKDAGYVIGVKGNGNSDTYYPLPDGEKLIEMQQQQLLPNPLPAYKLELLDYLIGYSLWIFLIASLMWVGFKKMFRRS